MKKRMLLVDANLLLYRSFFAAQAISKNSGNMTTHLFFNTFFDIVIQEKPEFVFLAFDARGKTKRHEIFSEYKAGRQKAPDELYQQKEIIISLLEKMKLFTLSKEGDEADDLIATITEMYKNNNEILILSEDRDLLQLIDNNVSIIVKNRSKDIKEKYGKITINNFYEKFEFHPYQVTDYKGIAGDNSDNLSGVKGIGPKTAVDLLRKYHNLENIYMNLDSLSEKQRNAFIQNKENSLMCKKLATLNKNVDISIQIDDLLIQKQNIINQEIINELEKLNLNRLQKIIKLL